MSDPVIDVGDVRNLVCPRHERALALDETVNAYAFPIEVLKFAMADERTMRACGWDPDVAGSEADLAKAGPSLRSVAPVCEWLPPNKTADAWQRARELGRGGKSVTAGVPA